MAQTVELLTAVHHTGKARHALKHMHMAIQACGDIVTPTTTYRGQSDWLVCWGIGAAPHNAARHIQNHRGHTLMLDMGYTRREDTWRFSIDYDHPHRLFDQTPDDKPPIAELKDTFNPAGHIIIAALGVKSRRYLKLEGWENAKYKALKKEFPGRRIIVKEKKDPTPFESLLSGASLVVARHSNCCIDAAIHNVPFRCEDGAALWLKDLADRELFLRKLARWQTNSDGAKEAWTFAKQMAQFA